VNRPELANDFRQGLEELVAEVRESFELGGPAAFAGAVVANPLEAVTRVHVIDGLMTLLGWRLGPGGNMAIEARIKGNTTTFMDYVGVTADLRAPVLIVEAKAWDKPFVTPRRRSKEQLDTRELIARGIQHIRNDGKKAESPVSGLWHDYLDQVHGYVKGLKTKYGYDVPRVVLTSGNWLVVFKSPGARFLGAGDLQLDDIVVFEFDEYVGRFREIFDLVARANLVEDIPRPLRVSQLADFIAGAALKACYRGLQITAHSDQHSPFEAVPRVWTHPTIVLERTDGAILIVASEGVLIDRGERFAGNRDEVEARGQALLADCSAVLGVALAPAPVGEFGGFTPNGDELRLGGGRRFVDGGRTSSEWFLVTGDQPHYVAAAADIECSFHAWVACGPKRIGTSAIFFPALDKPAALFIDGDPQHCAHQAQFDYREQRCHLHQIDQRPCCHTCVYRPVCWPEGHGIPVACGG
jgi:hypothetical protein